MYIIGFVFLITSIGLAIFKKENDDLEEIDENLNLFYSYKMIWRLFSLKPIRLISIFSLTVQV